MSKCFVKDCETRPTHGFSSEGQGFCHTHWWMLPPSIRVQIRKEGAESREDGVRLALVWHDRDAKKTRPLA